MTSFGMIVFILYLFIFITEMVFEHCGPDNEHCLISGESFYAFIISISI